MQQSGTADIYYKQSALVYSKFFKMSNEVSSTRPSPTFLTIPCEIRDTIYALVVTTNEPITKVETKDDETYFKNIEDPDPSDLAYIYDTFSKPFDKGLSTFHALILTSRQISFEARAAFFKINTFSFRNNAQIVHTHWSPAFGNSRRQCYRVWHVAGFTNAPLHHIRRFTIHIAACGWEGTGNASSLDEIGAAFVPALRGRTDVQQLHITFAGFLPVSLAHAFDWLRSLAATRGLLEEIVKALDALVGLRGIQSVCIRTERFDLVDVEVLEGELDDPADLAELEAIRRLFVTLKDKKGEVEELVRRNGDEDKGELKTEEWMEGRGNEKTKNAVTETTALSTQC